MPDYRVEVDWISVNLRLPPEGIEVMTKIDDSKGIRNEQSLKLRKNLWWHPDGSMYVYYTPPTGVSLIERCVMNNQDCPFRTPPTSGFPMSRERADWFFVSKNRDASQIHKDGVRVIGPNTSNGDITAWWFPNEELANKFAKILAEDTMQSVLVVSLLGLWKPTEPPVEHVTFAEGQEKQS